MIFSPALRPFLERRPDALDVLEIEPQTLWLADDAFTGPFYEFGPGIDLFQALPGHKLVHSVSLPLGGTRVPDPAQCALIRATADRLASPWVSEHLSVGGTPHQASGFFLPPLQTEASAEVAAANIRAFAGLVGRPVAVETGVAYLARKPFEMTDGVWLAEVAARADCGILLDLHNLYCNARNGRLDLDDFLRALPRERVWEVHLAGGMEMDGFWLDSHSGPIPPDLKAMAREVLTDLPNLGALNFEIYDSFLERTEERVLDDTVEDLRSLWAVAGRSTSDARPRDLAPALLAGAPSPALWEAALTEAIWKADPEAHPHPEDKAALALYARLARSFRGSMLARTLPRAIRYLILRERAAVEALLDTFYSAVSARLYAPLEAEAFAAWAATDPDRLLQGLLDYDLALLRTLRNGKPQIVRFPGNPGPVFEALADRRLPICPPPPEWELEILPDGPALASGAPSVAA
ncbi:DUF692 domain-containing protein [Rhodobacter sp. Har01]|uniref:DUF692 domain-containing protein n=1 Tax=Rhodobacter sp. Har01 TaxID=2883999 RepID=UPI001D094D30|nr:DUF692 family multinuclear iron-containing protein [Rhodobacter sp. Har01]MCB6178638.1 DUF692 domain-containing protein [Rhodobacter sp. Har01]